MSTHPEPPANANGPSSRARTIAGFLVLVASLVFFLLDAVSLPLFGVHFDLLKPAWVLLGGAAYFFFGLDITKFRISFNRLDDRSKEDQS